MAVIGEEALVGWRSTVADRAAPAVADHSPLSVEQVRAALGALFFGLSLYYVVATVVRVVRGAED